MGLSTLAVGSLGFGRLAEVVVDVDNPYLHGEAGRFRHQPSGWAIHNTGSTLPLRLLHQTGIVTDLPPGSGVALPVGHGRIQVTAGPTTYEVDYFLDGADPLPGVTKRRTGTLFYGRNLTPAQIDYAVTLAEPRLLGSRSPMPSHAQIADVWGVSQGAVRRTFETIRERLRAEGVRMIDSQERLLDYLIVNRVVTVELLEAARIHQPDGPVRRADILAVGGCEGCSDQIDSHLGQGG